MIEYRLYIGNRLSGHTVVQDTTYPTMYRVKYPDGHLSDIVNLSRAKDAAAAHAHPGGSTIISWDKRQTTALSSQAA